MRTLALVIQLKVKKWTLRLALLRYAIYQHPDSALFWFVMVALFLLQSLLYLGS